MRHLIIAVCLLLPEAVHANCVADPTRLKPSFPPDVLEKRHSLFLELCAKANGLLWDATDPTLEGRMVRPSDVKLPPVDSETFPVIARRLGIEGRVTLMYMVELDGSVHHATVLESSGHEILDAAALRLYSRTRYGKAAMLDNTPVRVVTYARVNSTLK